MCSSDLDEPMQEGKPRRTVKKRHDRRTRVKVLLVCPPRLQRAAGHVQHLGRLALGDPRREEGEIPVAPLSALHAIPALRALSLATLCVLGYSAHSYLLPQLIPCEQWIAQDGEVAPSLQALSVVSYPGAETSISARWPTR